MVGDFRIKLLPTPSSLNLMMEAAASSETLVPIYQATWRHIPELEQGGLRGNARHIRGPSDLNVGHDNKYTDSVSCFSSVYSREFRDNILEQGTTASSHISSNSLFINRPPIRRYIPQSTLNIVK
jgi:hypothetical protein